MKDSQEIGIGRVVSNKIRKALHEDNISRYLKDRSYPNPGNVIFIPTGPVGGVNYKEPWGDEQTIYRTGSNANVYKHELFSDEFETGKINLSQGIFRVKRKKKSSGVLAGGINNAFAHERIVLELGSGRARALLQFSKDYPETVFIGIDNRYEQREVVDIDKPGVHLIDDNWILLRTIPDHSVDTIISHKGFFTHGLHIIDESTISTIKDDLKKHNKQMMATLNRIAKPGTILRFDTNRGWSGNYETKDNYIENLLKVNDWDIYPTEGPTTVAIKKTDS